MKFTKVLSLLLALVLCATLFAACKKTPSDETTVPTDDAQTTAAEEETKTDAPDENGEDGTTAGNTDENIDIAEADRVPAKFAGTYTHERCSVSVEALSDTELKFVVHWGSSAFEYRQWEMSGFFDPDTLRVNYSNCVCKDVTTGEDGNTTETVKYENGVGRIQFFSAETLGWMDEQDGAADGIEFKLAPAEE